MGFLDEKPIERLAIRVKRVQDKLLAENAPERFEKGYRAFISAIDQETPQRRWPAAIRWAVSLSVAATAVFALWWIRTDRATTLSFTVGHEHTPGTVGGWITAPPDKSVPVDFSDGTRLALEPNTRARIGLYQLTAARIVLEAGSARVSVVHRERVQWRVDAGPFSVRVTGTRFKVSWNPELQLFEVTLREGAIIAEGPVLNQGQTVGRGQTLRVSLPRAMALLASTNALPSYRDWVASMRSDANKDRDNESKFTSEAQTESRRKRANGSDVRWMELAEQGHYEAALGAAEERGFHRLCRSLGVASLVRLAEVARFAGRVDRTEEALLVLRKRFPKHRESAIAAYTLGLAAFDQKRDYHEAEKWFEVYLRQQPSGPLAREALGRLMEAQYRLGRKPNAKHTARRYLDQYSDGPHADIAARLIDE